MNTLVATPYTSYVAGVILTKTASGNIIDINVAGVFTVTTISTPIPLAVTLLFGTVTSILPASSQLRSCQSLSSTPLQLSPPITTVTCILPSGVDVNQTISAWQYSNSSTNPILLSLPFGYRGLSSDLFNYPSPTISPQTLRTQSALVGTDALEATTVTQSEPLVFLGTNFLPGYVPYSPSSSIYIYRRLVYRSVSVRYGPRDAPYLLSCTVSTTGSETTSTQITCRTPSTSGGGQTNPFAMYFTVFQGPFVVTGTDIYSVPFLTRRCCAHKMLFLPHLCAMMLISLVALIVCHFIVSCDPNSKGNMGLYSYNIWYRWHRFKLCYTRTLLCCAFLSCYFCANQWLVNGAQIGRSNSNNLWEWMGSIECYRQTSSVYQW
jgi:hypothetical protein